MLLYCIHTYVRSYVYLCMSVCMYVCMYIIITTTTFLYYTYVCVIMYVQGYLISVTGNDTINLWSLRQRPAGVMNQLQLKKEKYVHCIM